MKVSVEGWYVGLLFLGVWLLGGTIANEPKLQGAIMDIIAVTESGYSSIHIVILLEPCIEYKFEKFVYLL